MLEQLLQALRAHEVTISAAVGLLTLCAALWGALRLTFRRREAAPGRDGGPGRPPRRGSWAALFNLGLSGHSRLEELVSVRSVNVVLLALGFVSLAWLAASLKSSDTALLTAINLFVLLSVLLGFAFQWSGRTGIARWLLVIAANVYWLGAMLAVGAMAGTEYFLAGTMLLPVLIFSRAEPSQMALAMILALLVFAAGVAVTRVNEPALVLPPLMASVGYYVNALLLAGIIFLSIGYYRRFAASSYHQLSSQKEKNDRLVSSLFPPRILQRIGTDERAVADWHPEAVVLYARVSGFSQLHNRLPAIELVGMLAEVYAAFDGLLEHHGLDKIKTLGTTYVAATGIGGQSATHAALGACALAMRESVATYAAERQIHLAFHCGIATGITISGVISDTRPRFDIWGEALEAAAQLGERAARGEILVDERVSWRLQERFDFRAPGSDAPGHELLGER